MGTRYGEYPDIWIVIDLHREWLSLSLQNEQSLLLN